MNARESWLLCSSYRRNLQALQENNKIKAQEGDTKWKCMLAWQKRKKYVFMNRKVLIGEDDNVLHGLEVMGDKLKVAGVLYNSEGL